MEFQDFVFPELACKGVSRSESLPLETIGNGTIEFRSTPVRWAGFTWNISSVGQTADVINRATSFIRRRSYGKNSFKFKDPLYPELNEEVLGSAGSNTWYLYLSEYDEVTGDKIAGSHPIFHPDTANITVTRNGSPAAFTFAITDGDPILTVTGSTPSDVIKVSGPYWYAVKLASLWTWTATTLTEDGYTGVGPASGVTGDIVLQEVFEY